MDNIHKIRIKKDISKLKKICDSIEQIDDKLVEFIINGPKDCLYEGGSWKVRISFPKEYPFKSPSVGFVNTIYHPNIDESSGSICLDVLNQEWVPIYSLVNIYETFLPQLLTYPNPDDPLNEEAGDLMKTNIKEFTKKVKEYINNYSI